MRATIKKWIALCFEFAFFIVFTGFGLLRGDQIRSDWAHLLEKGATPKALAGWGTAGLLLYLSRIFAGRYGKAEARGILSSPDFVKAYRAMLSKAMEMLPTAAELEKNKLDDLEKDLLVAMADTVQYFRKATAFSAPRVTCSLMVPGRATEGMKNNLWLEPGGFENLECVLKIEKTSRDELAIPADFALPVYSRNGPFRDRNLYGAPTAYLTGERQNINFTLFPVWHRGRASWRVFWKTWRYFLHERKVFWSFASLPLVWKKEVKAVVNLHYKWFGILGKNPELRLDFLFPFLFILAYIRGVKELKQ